MGIKFSNIISNLMAVVSGGKKIQSGSGTATVAVAGTEVTATITFPVAFSGTPKVYATLASLGATSATYVTLQPNVVSSSQFTTAVNSGVAQVINFNWIAIGN